VYQRRKCFTDSGTLRSAVEAYLEDSSEGTAIANTYGHPIGTWCVEDIQDFSFLFSGIGNTRAFGESLAGWDTSSATTMSRMFLDCERCNPDIKSWDTSSVTDMSGMFANTKLFNQDVSTWDVASVTNMEFMFANADLFNQNLCSWNSEALKGANTAMFLGTRCPFANDPGPSTACTSCPVQMPSWQNNNDNSNYNSNDNSNDNSNVKETNNSNSGSNIKQESKVGVIVGAVVGGIVASILIVAVVLLRKKKMKHPTSTSEGYHADKEITVTTIDADGNVVRFDD